MSGQFSWPDGIKRGEIPYWDGSGPARLGGAGTGYVLMWTAGGVPVWVPPASVAALLDHGLLLGRADDDHVQYALLAGRSGGQVLVGSPGPDNLYLFASSNAPGGRVIIGRNFGLEVDEVLGNVFVRNWLRVGGMTAPTQALAVTGDIGGSNELQVPRGRFTDNNLVYNTLTVGQNSLVNQHAIDVRGDGIIDLNTGIRIGNAAPLGNVLRGNASNFVSSSLSPSDLVGGAWTTIPFNAADYTADVGNWTVAAGDLWAGHYAIVGKTMFVSLSVLTSTISATPSFLFFKIPASKVGARYTYAPCIAQIGATQYPGPAAQTVPGDTRIYIRRDWAATLWPAAVDTVTVIFNLTFEIQ